MSALAEKLAPIAGASKLYMRAVDAIRQNLPVGINDAMAERFVDRLIGQEPLLAELVGREYLLAAGIVFLDRVAADMRGEEARSRLPQSQKRDASSQPNSSSAKVLVPQGHSPYAEEEPLSTGQNDFGNQLGSAGRNARGKGQRKVCFPIERCPPARPSSTSRAAALAARTATAQTVLDSYKVRGGRALGDVILAEIRDLSGQNTRENALFRLIEKHAGNAPGNTRIRDVIKVADIERFIQRAAEMQDALA